MILRRVPMLVITVAVLVVVAVTARDTVSPVNAVFSNVSAAWMPSAPLPGGLTSSWFCPGVPAAGEDGAGGSVAVFNTEETALHGRLTVLQQDGEPVTQDIEVAAYESEEFDLDALVDTPYAAAFVEIDGGGGLVEQRAVHPAAESVATCANASHDEWYLAAGDTLEDSLDQIVISNPHDYPAVVDMTFATERGARVPDALQSFAVPAQSVRVVNINEAVIADQSWIGVSVVATRGRVVVGRAQVFATESRTGYAMTLGATARREQWWFVYGEQAESVVENYYVYNPGDNDVEVQPVLLGFPPPEGFEAPDSFVVPEGEVVEFRMADVAGLPDGAHSVVFGTLEGGQVVVERVITRTIENVRTTSVTMGATPRPDTYVPTTWYVGLAPDAPESHAVVVNNITTTDAVVTVEAITPSGVQVVPGLEEVQVAANAIVPIDLSNELARSNELIVRSTTQVFVERILPREPEAQGRVAVWAVPANT